MSIMNGNTKTSTYYYKYEFVSPEPIFALVKEEMRSYFEAGAVDDTMFPIWMRGILKKLGKASYPILETVLFQKDFESKLPNDFHGVREAVALSRLGEGEHHTEFPRIIQSPNSIYEQVFCKVTPEVNECDPCNDCFPEIIRVTYKNNLVGPYSPDLKFRRTHLLKPGNIQVGHLCDLPCMNFGAKSLDTFDLRDGKFITNIRETPVHLKYYAKESTEDGYQLIPDNYWIMEYVKRYLKFKSFEQLWNQTTDESYNQIKQKMDYYKSSYDEAVIMAEIEIKKKTVYEHQQDWRRNANRLNPYIIR